MGDQGRVGGRGRRGARCRAGSPWMPPARAQTWHQGLYVESQLSVEAAETELSVQADGQVSL